MNQTQMRIAAQLMAISSSLKIINHSAYDLSYLLVREQKRFINNLMATVKNADTTLKTLFLNQKDEKRNIMLADVFDQSTDLLAEINEIIASMPVDETLHKNVLKGFQLLCMTELLKYKQRNDAKREFQ